MADTTDPHSVATLQTLQTCVSAADVRQALWLSLSASNGVTAPVARLLVIVRASCVEVLQLVRSVRADSDENATELSLGLIARCDDLQLPLLFACIDGRSLEDASARDKLWRLRADASVPLRESLIDQALYTRSHSRSVSESSGNSNGDSDNHCELHVEDSEESELHSRYRSGTFNCCLTVFDVAGNAHLVRLAVQCTWETGLSGSLTAVSASITHSPDSYPLPLLIPECVSELKPDIIADQSSITPDGPLTVFWRSDVGESQAATWIPIHTQICRGRILHADIVSMSDDEVNVIVLIRDDERRLDPEGQGLDLTNFREEVIAPDDVCIEYMVGRRNPSSSEVDPPSSFIVSQSYYALPLAATNPRSVRLLPNSDSFIIITANMITQAQISSSPAVELVNIYSFNFTEYDPVSISNVICSQDTKRFTVLSQRRCLEVSVHNKIMQVQPCTIYDGPSRSETSDLFASDVCTVSLALPLEHTTEALRSRTCLFVVARDLCRSKRPQSDLLPAEYLHSSMLESSSTINTFLIEMYADANLQVHESSIGCIPFVDCCLAGSNNILALQRSLQGYRPVAIDLAIPLINVRGGIPAHGLQQIWLLQLNTEVQIMVLRFPWRLQILHICKQDTITDISGEISNDKEAQDLLACGAYEGRIFLKTRFNLISFSIENGDNPVASGNVTDLECPEFVWNVQKQSIHSDLACIKDDLLLVYDSNLQDIRLWRLQALLEKSVDGSVSETQMQVLKPISRMEFFVFRVQDVEYQLVCLNEQSGSARIILESERSAIFETVIEPQIFPALKQSFVRDDSDAKKATTDEIPFSYSVIASGIQVLLFIGTTRGSIIVFDIFERKIVHMLSMDSATPIKFLGSKKTRDSANKAFFIQDLTTWQVLIEGYVISIQRVSTQTIVAGMGDEAPAENAKIDINLPVDCGYSSVPSRLFFTLQGDLIMADAAPALGTTAGMITAGETFAHTPVALCNLDQCGALIVLRSVQRIASGDISVAQLVSDSIAVLDKLNLTSTPPVVIDATAQKLPKSSQISAIAAGEQIALSFRHGPDRVTDDTGLIALFDKHLNGVKQLELKLVRTIHTTKPVSVLECVTICGISHFVAAYESVFTFLTSNTSFALDEKAVAIERMAYDNDKAVFAVQQSSCIDLFHVWSGENGALHKAQRFHLKIADGMEVTSIAVNRFSRICRHHTLRDDAAANSQDSTASGFRYNLASCCKLADNTSQLLLWQMNIEEGNKVMSTCAVSQGLGITQKLEPVLCEPLAMRMDKILSTSNGFLCVNFVSGKIQELLIHALGLSVKDFESGLGPEDKLEVLARNKSLWNEIAMELQVNEQATADFDPARYYVSEIMTRVPL